MVDKLKLNIDLAKCGMTAYDIVDLSNDYWEHTNKRKQKHFISGTIRTAKYNGEADSEKNFGWHYTLNTSKQKDFVTLTTSPANNIFGTNFHTPTLSQVMDFLRTESNRLKINLLQCKVNRLDIATNFIMEESPEVYYHYLGSETGWKWYPYGKGSRRETSQWSHNMNLTKLFYNKCVWAKDKQKHIPLEYSDSNVLRFEMRWTSNASISRQLHIDTPLLNSVLVEERFLQLVEAYKQYYKNIPRINNFKIQMDKITTPAELRDAIYTMAVKEMGEERHKDLIGVTFPDDRQNRYRYKKIHKAATEQFRSSNSYIEELDSKILAYQAQ